MSDSSKQLWAAQFGIFMTQSNFYLFIRSSDIPPLKKVPREDSPGSWSYQADGFVDPPADDNADAVIVMSPQSARDLASLLRGMVDNYEREVVPLSRGSDG